MSRKLLLCYLLFACALQAQAFFTPVTVRSIVVEYVNEISGHYVLLADTAEMAAVDRGDAGPGWRRTGYAFGEEWTCFNTCNPPTLAPVCRVYSTTNNTHLFSTNLEECANLVGSATGWIRDKTAFEITAPVGGQCPANRDPVYRLYNNRHAFADANHRYVIRSELRDAMVAAGWIYEGIAFCPGYTVVQPDARIYLGSEPNRDPPLDSLAGCNIRAGTCVAIGQLPAMTTRIEPWLPPAYITRNPDYPASAIAAMTGLTDVPLRTSLPAGSPQLPDRSFLQVGNPAGPWGIHVNGADRLAGPYASVSPMFRLADGQTYPWRHLGESSLYVTASAAVTSLRRSNPGAHAYGGPVLQFVDGVTGDALWITLQAFGTVPEGDFVGLDVGTGTPIVSTSFRAQPAFGRRLSGQFTRCVPEVDAPCLPTGSSFRFVLGKADFQRALAMAHEVRPALSLDPTRYFLQAFRFQAETYLDASLSMRFGGMFVEVWPF